MFIATLESGIKTMAQQERIVNVETELEQLKAAVQANRIVEQATGAISVRHRMSPNEASRCCVTGDESAQPS
jgi:AmiR/NasT family two-component response regulator